MRAVNPDLKPLALECYVNILNIQKSLKYIISEDTCPAGKTEKMVDSVWPKYELPNMEKRV